MKVGAKSTSVIRELAITIKNTTKSSKVDILVVEMNSAAQELRDLLKSYSNLVNPPSHNNAQGTQPSEASSPDQELAPEVDQIPLMEIIQVATIASLLIEIVARVEDIVKDVEELSDMAEFKQPMCVKSKQHEHIADNNFYPTQQKHEEGIKTLEMV